MTKQQKLEAYTFALLMFYNDQVDEQTQYVCDYLEVWCREYDIFPQFGFPEIIKPPYPWCDRPYVRYGPQISGSCGWWKQGSPARLKAIKKAIQLTELLP